MGLFRNRRWLVARNVIVALVAYVVAATGLMGAAAHAARVAEAGPGGFVVICTVDGLAFAHQDGAPGKAHPPADCALCQVTGAMPAPEPVREGVAVAPPVIVRAPGRSYDPILPLHAFAGWLGTRSPRAPPVSVA